jgi:hypothetical protein
MAYSTFTFESLQDKLGITVRETSHAFDSIPPLQPSNILTMALSRGLPIAVGAGKEKARSEALVFPILLEVREQLEQQVSLFSGPEFNVDKKQGLSGFCDYLMSRSPLQMAIHTPVVAIFEAKHEDLTQGVPQCVAAMHAARLFNQQRDNPTETVYGATTSGTTWRFLRLTGLIAETDLTEYHISNVDKILGILVHLTAGRA